MNTFTLRHFFRIHTMRDEDKKSFALISRPDEEGDSCVTLVRCKAEKVAKEMKYWTICDQNDIENIQNLEPGQQYRLDDPGLIIRLS